MTLPAYDILKKQGIDFVWMEAAQDFESANKRVTELSRDSNSEFVIFNGRTLQVLANSFRACE